MTPTDCLILAPVSRPELLSMETAPRVPSSQRKSRSGQGDLAWQHYPTYILGDEGTVSHYGL